MVNTTVEESLFIRKYVVKKINSEARRNGSGNEKRLREGIYICVKYVFVRCMIRKTNIHTNIWKFITPYR